LKQGLDEFSLENKNVLVTGAMGLIGKEVSSAMARAGANIVLADIDDGTKIENYSNNLSNEYGVKTLPVNFDISESDSVKNAVKRAIDSFGRIDVLVHLAAKDAKFDKEVKDITEFSFENFPYELWEKSVQVNITGTFLITKEVVKTMIKNGGGNIILVASTYSLVAPNQSLYEENGKQTVFKPVDYVATKSFIPNYTRYLATLYGRKNIRVNTIVPHGVFNEHPKHFEDKFSEYSPMGRMCRVEELRGPFVFLASDASTYMTGSTLVVDGGWTAW
jgi:NAD(P)-dependent dehydrogenase (short-subunit alcohol dehydrogenase family)